MLLHEAEFWVAVGFFLFIGLLFYFGVPKRMTGALDQRAGRIKAELDEALKLRREAEGLLAEYKRKRAEADREAEAIIAGANAEAERVAAEAKTRMEEFIARRTALAQTKIAQAEAQALADVRAAAAEAAVTAAERILADSAKGKVADDLLERGIRDVKARLN
ncbi:MAG: ATP F0F1 synthase subunit B [Xanthobacteraceae bacterium]